MPFAKTIVVVLLLLIILSLAGGLFSLVRERGESTRTVKFLTLRIALSIVTFVFIALAFYMGWLKPHGLLPPGT